MANRRRGIHRRGFSLLEVLIVIGIIALLVGLLMPVIGNVRRSARAAGCLANLQQWGHAYQMYVDGNGGHSFVLGPLPTHANNMNTPPMWWEMLQPYQQEAGQMLLCGEATEPANVTPSNAFQAWGPQYFYDSPTKVRGPFVGSYGFNSWLYHPHKTEDGPPPPESIRLPTKEASHVPVIVDCARMDLNPSDTDEPYLYEAKKGKGAMRWAALERHKDGVNALFLDGHAEQVSVPGLWKLKWSDAFGPKEVTLRR